jgi:hypothetical protein
VNLGGADLMQNLSQSLSSSESAAISELFFLMQTTDRLLLSTGLIHDASNIIK